MHHQSDATLGHCGIFFLSVFCLAISHFLVRLEEQKGKNDKANDENDAQRPTSEDTRDEALKRTQDDKTRQEEEEDDKGLQGEKAEHKIKLKHL